MVELSNKNAAMEQAFKCSEVIEKGMYSNLFPKHLQITPQLNEVYELALAFYESHILSNEEIIQNGAYFACVNKQYTRHFYMCTGDTLHLPQYSSSRLKSFFETNQFRTGYATHGLFPYRGKFHPQMIKALINIMGLKPGDTILDPMMGSGTVPIEAGLMGINSIGFDASPFCQFMANTKFKALTLPNKLFKLVLQNYMKFFEFFVQLVGHPSYDSPQNHYEQNIVSAIQSSVSKESLFKQFSGFDQSGLYNFLLLVYLDSVGYSERSKRMPPIEQFRSILERYIFVVEKIQRVMGHFEFKIGNATIKEGDARSMQLNKDSVDGILFSPPYSFAINYLENDSFHLKAMGSNLLELKEKMIGLRGRGIREKFDLYIQDMDKVLAECGRILKPFRFCTIIIGTNDSQLSKALNIPKKKVSGLHQILIETASKHGFSLVRSLPRKIMGMANTMRNEYIIILQRNATITKNVNKVSENIIRWGSF